MTARPQSTANLGEKTGSSTTDAFCLVKILLRVMIDQSDLG